MWLLLLFLLGAAPAWAEDLGELSANPAGLSGSFGLSGGVSDPTNKTNQIDQTNEIDQFRLSYGRGLRIEGR
jgi:hypothetical protein